MHRATRWILSIGIFALAGCASGDNPGTSSAARAANGIPGDTLGNAVLQRDSKLPVFMAASRKMTNKDCPGKAYELQDTKVLSPPEQVQGRAANTHWKELWTVKGCDETVDVEVTYMQHARNGVTIGAN